MPATILNRGRIISKPQKFGFRRGRRFRERPPDLDPDYAPAQKALSYYRKKDLDTGTYKINGQPDAPVSFKFKNTPIINVFEVLTKLSGINFIFDKEVQNNKVTMFMTDVSFDRFIDVLLRSNDLNAVLINEKTMIIYPDTPQKAKEYEDLQIKPFICPISKPNRPWDCSPRFSKAKTSLPTKISTPW